jgi:hypothetical protein
LNEALKDISALSALADAKAELEVALRHGLIVGQPTHVIDREHIEKAAAILKLIVEAQRNG